MTNYLDIKIIILICYIYIYIALFWVLKPLWGNLLNHHQFFVFVLYESMLFVNCQNLFICVEHKN